MAEQARWPLATYFDTSLLRSLPPNLASPDLVRLTEVTGKYNIGRFIPAVAKREWIFLHQEIVRKKYNEMLANARTLGQYLQREPLKTELVKLVDLLAGVEQAQETILKSAGFVEIPTPRVDLEDLVEKAIKRIKPFAEGDKGFRDTLIVLSIREHAARFAGHSVLIVTTDTVFGAPEVRRLLEDIDVRPLMARTLAEAVIQLEGEMDEAVKRTMDLEAEKIKQFLVLRQAQIFDHLKDVEISEELIKGSFSQSQAYFGTLEQVRNITPVGVTKVSRGHILGPFKTEGQRVPVTFYVKIAFGITVREVPFYAVLGRGARIRLGDAEFTRSTTGLPPLDEVTREIVVEREIPMQGWAVMDSQGAFTDLEIEKVRSW